MCLLLLVGMGAASALPLYSTAMLTLLLMPTFLLLTAFTAGLWSMAGCFAITQGLLVWTGGAPLMGFGLLYLAPMCAAFAYCLGKQRPFWQTVGIVLAALMASTAALYAILQGITGGNLYAAAADAAASVLGKADGALYMFCRTGLIGLPPSMQETAIVQQENGLFFFSDAARRELLLQVRSLVMQLLKGALPSLLVSGSVISVLSGVGLGIHFGRRAAQRRVFKNGDEENAAAFPDLSMPPLHRWYIPQPWGRRIGILAVGYIIMRVQGNETLLLLGALMWQTFFVCYAVQGLAVVSDMQRKRGIGRFGRTALVAAAFMLGFIQTALMIVGVFEQISNARGLRPKAPMRKEEE